MEAEPFISRILDDEGLTTGLNDPEARLLIEWLVERAEQIAAEAVSDRQAWQQVEALCRRARLVRRFVSLWCHQHEPEAALQLAGSERLNGPLPSPDCANPCDIMQALLRWEQEHPNE